MNGGFLSSAISNASCARAMKQEGFVSGPLESLDWGLFSLGMGPVRTRRRSL